MNRKAKVLLVTALVAVVGMAFRVSWNALRDVAHAVGADETAAMLYPFVVDGLMALALVATLALTGKDRAFALRVLAGYTLASLALNYVHGLVPTMQAGQRMHLAEWSPANWVLVLLATSLPVGAIYFGSDLVAKVLHHQTASVPEAAVRTDVVRTGPETVRTAPETGELGRKPVRTAPSTNGASVQDTPRTPPAQDRVRSAPVRPQRPSVRTTRSKTFEDAELERTRQRAEQAYADSLDAGAPIGPAALGREFGFSEGWGRKRIKAVDVRRAALARSNLHVVAAQGSS